MTSYVVLLWRQNIAECFSKQIEACCRYEDAQAWIDQQFRMRVKRCPGTVSYTHLDVYKRQRSRCGSAATAVTSSWARRLRRFAPPATIPRAILKFTQKKMCIRDRPRTQSGEKNLISQRLIELRKTHNMSQRDLAYKLQLAGYDMRCV